MALAISRLGFCRLGTLKLCPGVLSCDKDQPVTRGSFVA